VHQVNRPTHFN